jgi:hypothetical protein
MGKLRSFEVASPAGVPVDMQDNTNWKPLAYAVGGKQENVVHFLLSNGADPKVKSVVGMSIVNLAVEQRFEKGLKALLQAGAEPPATRARSQSQPQLPTYRVDDQVPHGKYQNISDLPFLVVESLGAGAPGTSFLPPGIHNSSIQLVRKICHFYRFKELRVDLPGITNEVRILQRLRHRHIVKLISTYETPKAFGFFAWPVGERNLSSFLDR